MTALRIAFLSKADRERYGLSDEPIELDVSVVYQDEAEDLDDYGVDADGKAWYEWLNSPDKRVWRVLVWLALRRAGVDIGLREVKFDRRRIGWLQPEQTESPGKGDSETSGSPTPPPSSDDSPA